MPQRPSQAMTCDVSSADFRRNPYPVYRRLRSDDPVHYDREGDVWLVTRYDDVVRVLAEPQVFSNRGVASFESHLLGADPPEHAPVRGVVSRAFSRRQIAGFAQPMWDQARALIDRLRDRRECDLVSDLAGPLPLQAIALMLGFEPNAIADLKRWTRATTQADGWCRSESEALARRRCIEEFHRFFDEHVDRVLAGSTEGGLLRHLLPTGDRAGLSRRQLQAVAKLMLVAGNETTTNLIGNAMLALLDHPEAMAACHNQPELIPAMIEEVLRYDGPVQSVKRRTAREVRLGDVQIPCGSLVYAVIGSANRDEERFPDPDSFDIWRKTSHHIAFGYGAHYCLGAELARLQTRITFETLFGRLPIPQRKPSDADIEFLPSPHLRGPTRLELIFPR